MAEPFRVLSLGAGVDSTTLLLMSEHGEVPRLDAAIFADTHAEPQGVYDTLAWLTAAVTIPIYRVSAGNIETALLEASRSGQRVATPPLYVRNAANDGTPAADSGGRLWRQCTRDYKITPIRQKLRELVSRRESRLAPAMPVEQWIGFTINDLGRTFCSRVQWIVNRFPLIEQRMRRNDCVTWLQRHSYPVPMKSSCVWCPYHSNRHWREMRDERPLEWANAVEFEATLQQGHLAKTTGMVFLHRSMVPLPMAPIDAPDTGQEELFCMHCNT